jgi:hypothetical protein
MILYIISQAFTIMYEVLYKLSVDSDLEKNNYYKMYRIFVIFYYF